MTALCVGGGTSSAKPGYDRLLNVAPWVVAGLITDIPPVTAAAIGAAVGNQLYDLSSFCLTDPPTMPTIGFQDVVDVLTPENPFVFVPAARKFSDLIANYAWRVFCQCNAGTQPPAPTTPPALSDYNPQPSVGTQPTTSGHCFDSSVYSVDIRRDLAAGPTNAGNTLYPITSRFLTTPGPLGTAPPFTGTMQTYRMPAGATQIRLRGHNYSTTSRGQNVIYGAQTYNAAGANVSGISGSSIPNTLGDWDSVPLNPGNVGTGAIYVAVYFELRDTDPSAVEDVELIFDCGSNAPSAVTPCCPPDASLMTSIQQILGYVQLLQRQTAPFAYSTGATHSVSGNGELTVQGLLGCKVQLDSYGSSVGIESGDPAEFFEAGWFAWGGTDGFHTRELITHSPQVSFPAAAGQFTRIGYTLGDAVTATITELVREP